MYPKEGGSVVQRNVTFSVELGKLKWDPPHEEKIIDDQIFLLANARCGGDYSTNKSTPNSE